MIIAVDAAGGDYFPESPVQGSILAIKEDPSLKIILVGPKDIIESELNKHTFDLKRIEVVHAEEIIGMHESPATAVRDKKYSSIAVGLNLHKEGKCDAFLSAGNTGALLAASTLILGRLEGVIRPTIAAYYPTVKGFRLLIDAGANLEVKPEMAVQFAKMGQVFCESIMNIQNPKVGLLNVGEEEEKGTDNLKKIHESLTSIPGFVGNIEGRDIFPATADVFISDGLVGNILLKFGESIPYALKEMVKNTAGKGVFANFSLLIARNILKKSLSPFNYEHVGGIPFLGVNGVSLVGHGGSTPLAIKNMIKSAVSCIQNNINSKIIASLN